MNFMQFVKVELFLFLTAIIFFVFGLIFHNINEFVKSKANNGYKYTIRMMSYNISDFFIRLWWFINGIMIAIGVFYFFYFCATSILSIW